MCYNPKKRTRENPTVFGVSMWEVLLILVVALIALGPRQMADTARVLGKLYRDLQKMLVDVKSSVDFDTLMDSRPEPPKPPASPPPANLFQNKDAQTGPDFYAELLASSKEEDKPEQKENIDVKDKQEPQKQIEKKGAIVSENETPKAADK